jgi:hypothetical protein
MAILSKDPQARNRPRHARGAQGVMAARAEENEMTTVPSAENAEAHGARLTQFRWRR